MSALGLNSGEKTGEPPRYQREMVVHPDFSPRRCIPRPLHTLRAISNIAISPAIGPPAVLWSLDEKAAKVEILTEAVLPNIPSFDY